MPPERSALAGRPGNGIGLGVAAKINPDERTLIQRMEAALIVLDWPLSRVLSFQRPDGPFPRTGRGHARRFVDQMIHNEKEQGVGK
jgi:hypothetical protein